MNSPEEQHIGNTEQSKLRKLVAATIGCFAVLLTGDPDGFDTRKK